MLLVDVGQVDAPRQGRVHVQGHDAGGEVRERDEQEADGLNGDDGRQVDSLARADSAGAEFNHAHLVATIEQHHAAVAVTEVVVVRIVHAHIGEQGDVEHRRQRRKIKTE